VLDKLVSIVAFYLLAGRPPDFLAFVITLLMMLLMAAGVKKSLVFNNVLNVVNLAVWVFIMAAGMFYVDSANWTEHKGFLPFGWSGVSFIHLLFTRGARSFLDSRSSSCFNCSECSLIYSALPFSM
jgi:amino acid transporter